MPGSDDDDDPRRPPPHPLDRTWIHPSELGAARAATGERTGRSIPSRSWRREAALAVTAGAIGALATVLVLAALGAFDTEPQRAASTTSIPVSTDAATIATRVGPAVAAITATAGIAQTRGSGIVIGPHEILTTSDVVEPTNHSGGIEVSVASGHQHSARVKAADPVTRLVLLDVPELRMQPVNLGTPEDVRAGDWVVAVGRTSTTGPWVTSGVVTATRGWTQDANGVGHPGLITTNTAVVDEARGGALVDGRGHVVGILAMTAAGAPRASAMPADMADEVATQLTETGKATHGALGVEARDTGAGAGAVVSEVVSGSSAARAGIRVDDRIVAVDETATPDTATLVYELRRRQAGANTRVTLQRGKRRLVVTATLADAATTSTTTPGGVAPLTLTVVGPG